MSQSTLPTQPPVWDLTDIYPGLDSPELSADLTTLEKNISDFSAKYAKNLLEAVATQKDYPLLAQAIKEFEGLKTIIRRIAVYASLVHSEDTTDPQRSEFFGNMEEKLTGFRTKLTFFTIVLNKIDQSCLDRALNSNSELDHYRPWLQRVREFKNYQLSEELEKLFSEKSYTSSAAWGRLFEETIGKLRFEVDGQALGIESCLELQANADGNKRKAASEALASGFKENLPLVTHILNTLVKDKAIEDNWRGFKSPEARRHLSNQIEPGVVETLNEAVCMSYPRISHRYYKLKAKWLGKEKLEYWDRHAPLPGGDDNNDYIEWDEARDLVLEALNRFSPEMANIGRRFFDQDWIHATIMPGKGAGAFCATTIPELHPYLLVNYSGTPRSVMTLAHELGHGIHGVLAADNGLFNSHTPLTLAETASVFGEMLTFRLLLERGLDKRQRKKILAEKIEDGIGTVVHQIAFYNFEKRIHQERKGGELSSDAIGKIWLEVQSESMGPAINLSAGYATYWGYVKHFFEWPFYVYAYAFGECLVNSLYAIYQKSSTGFDQLYLDLLKAGGSKRHHELLAPFGLDVRDPGFWNQGLGMLEDMIDQVEAIDN